MPGQASIYCEVRMRAELVPIDGGSPIPIVKDITVIGRREFCDVQLDDPSLSKRHCVVIKTDGLLMIRDLASTNGTRVKGQLIRWAALLPNDRIAIGKLKFRVFLGPAESQIPIESKSTPTQRDRPVPVGARVPHAPGPKSSIPMTTVARPVSVARDHEIPDLDDDRWFDRVARVARDDDEIIDLD